MRKFLLSVLLCAGIVSTVSPMERPKPVIEFYGLPAEVVPLIVCQCDCSSFLTLMQVSKGLRLLCPRINVKFLVNIPFSDVARSRNNNLIDRFMLVCDSLMFEPGLDEEVFRSQDQDEGKIIKVVKRAFGRQMQSFMKDCSMYCISQNDEVCSCFWTMKQGDALEVTVSRYLIEDPEIIDQIENVYRTLECLKHGVLHDMTITDKRTNIICLVHSRNHGTGNSCEQRNLCDISSLLESSDNKASVFDMITMLLVAACNHDVEVVELLLSNQLSDKCTGEIIEAIFFMGGFNSCCYDLRQCQIKKLLWDRASGYIPLVSGFGYIPCLPAAVPAPIDVQPLDIQEWFNPFAGCCIQ